jgi:hypothetical protein
MVRLISTVVCDDVLMNPADRVTLYSVFRELWADAYPAAVVRLHVVNTWLNSDAADRGIVERVTILAPDNETLVAEAAGTLTVGTRGYHTQVNRFRDLIFPEPGTYRVQVQRDAELVADLPLILAGPSETEEGTDA